MQEELPSNELLASVLVTMSDMNAVLERLGMAVKLDGAIVAYYTNAEEWDKANISSNL